jgi:hypothetical protein
VAVSSLHHHFHYSSFSEIYQRTGKQGARPLFIEFINSESFGIVNQGKRPEVKLVKKYVIHYILASFDIMLFK